MNTSLSVDLILYSAVLTALSLVADRLDHDRNILILSAKLAGAVLCLAWGIAGLRGLHQKRGPIILLAVLASLLLFPTTMAWHEVTKGVETAKLQAVIHTVLFGMAFGQLMNFFQKRAG